MERAADGRRVCTHSSAVRRRPRPSLKRATTTLNSRVFTSFSTALSVKGLAPGLATRLPKLRSPPSGEGSERTVWNGMHAEVAPDIAPMLCSTQHSRTNTRLFPNESSPRAHTREKEVSERARWSGTCIVRILPSFPSLLPPISQRRFPLAFLSSKCRLFLRLFLFFKSCPTQTPPCLCVLSAKEGCWQYLLCLK